MARQDLSITEIGPYNDTVTTGFVAPDVSNGDRFINNGRCVVFWRNRDTGATKVVTVNAVAGVRSFNETPDIGLTIPANTGNQTQLGVAGFIAHRVYNDSDGYCDIDYTATTTNFEVLVLKFNQTVGTYSP